MSKPAARLTDLHLCPMVTPGVPPIPHVGGPIISPGHPTTLIAGIPAARVTDMAICVGPPDTIIMGSFTVLIGGLAAARMGDSCAHGGVIASGCPTVLIGDSGGGAGSPQGLTMSAAKAAGAAFTQTNCALKQAVAATKDSPLLLENHPASTKLCTTTAVCTAKPSTAKCEHGARGGKLGPGNLLQVVPEDAVHDDTITFQGNSKSCGKPITWSVSGGKTEKDDGASHKLNVSAGPKRAGTGIAGLLQWGARVAPNRFAVRATLPCGTLSESFVVEAYPNDPISIKVEPDKLPVYKAIKEYLIDGFLQKIFPNLEFDALHGSFSVEAAWKEDDHSWQAYYAYDIAIGFDPLIQATAKVTVLEIAGAMVAIPPSATHWLEKYVGDALYLSLAAGLTLQVHLARIAIDNYSHWSVELEGDITLELGFDLKAGSGDLLSATAKGSAELAAVASVGPKETDTAPYVLLDLKFNGLIASCEVEVASGWFKFEEKYTIIGEKELLSNHRTEIIPEAGAGE